MPRAMPSLGGHHVPDTPTLDIVGIGNAIVDVIAHAEENFLTMHGLAKGTMTLIDEAQADRLYGEMGPAVEYSGGSVANSMAGAAALGARAAYIGKVRDDQLGTIFGHDIRAAGVAFGSRPANGGTSTARCFILVTPDAHRTMCTYLGACRELGPDDVDRDLVASAKVTYLEGYLWDDPGAKAAFRVAMDAARAAGRKVSLTLSDPFCVDRHRDDFLQLVEHDVDILFANEHEIVSLYQAADFDDALQHVRHHCEIAALTRSEKGSVIVANDEVHVVDAEPVAHVLDTTGAGDLYAAGFLWGYTQGKDLRACARAGGIAAAEIISHFGARSEDDLAALMAAARIG
jgi:sugar/nucleoside kinase (ribokinase family)